jgi:hypothetical protein
MYENSGRGRKQQAEPPSYPFFHFVWIGGIIAIVRFFFGIAMRAG